MTSPLEMRTVSKSFGAVRALDQVDLTIQPGSIHAVVGENGAGKTTLMKILYGQYHADSGSIRYENQDRTIQNSRDAIALGIGMVSQHYSIIPQLTCLENLLLGAEPGMVMDLKSARIRAEELATRMGFSFNWNAEASTLSSASAQKLEILKLLWRESKLLILDEPTAMLSPADSDALYASLRRLTQEGATVIVVTHRLPEVMDHCADVTVLRGGKLVVARPVKQTTAQELSDAIVGHSVAEVVRSSRPTGKPILEVRDLVVRGERGDDALKGISFDLHEGEVVGLAGVDGNGQHELFQALIGLGDVISGSILLGGRDLRKMSSSEILEQGVRLIPEDRHAEGVIEDWTLEENSALGLQRIPPFVNGAFIDAPGRTNQAQEMVNRFQTKCAGIHAKMRSLSGGNQQRFVAARALSGDAKLILAFQPTRGLDIHGTLQVYEALREKSAKNATVLVVSFDLDELLEHCDRVLALNNGRLYIPAAGKERDRQAIGNLMVGAA